MLTTTSQHCASEKSQNAALQARSLKVYVYATAMQQNWVESKDD